MFKMQPFLDSARARHHTGEPCWRQWVHLTAALVAALILAPAALAAEPGGSIPLPPSVRGSITASSAMTPAQKIATLEEALGKEPDRRTDLDARVAAHAQENSNLALAQEALVRVKRSVDGELARSREALSRVQRDFESLRGDYPRIAKTVGLSLAFIAPLTLLIFALLGWLVLITRKLAARVHDVPTLAMIRESQTDVAKLHDQLNAEKGHNAVLRERLTNLGIAD